jgi:hypothetical protein
MKTRSLMAMEIILIMAGLVSAPAPFICRAVTTPHKFVDSATVDH